MFLFLFVWRDLELLAVLLCDIAKFLGEQSYLDHYIRDFPGLSKNAGMSKTFLSCKTPPSLFRWLENCLLLGCDSANLNDLSPLICQNASSVVSWGRKVVSFYSLLSGAKQIGKKLSSGVYCNIAVGSHCTKEELTVLAMVGERFGLKQLDLLPSGVSLPLRHVSDATIYTREAFEESGISLVDFSFLFTELVIFSALYRHWISAGNLLPLTGLQLLMFCLVERTWLCHVWHVHASLKNLKPKQM